MSDNNCGYIVLCSEFVYIYCVSFCMMYFCLSHSTILCYVFFFVLLVFFDFLLIFFFYFCLLWFFFCKQKTAYELRISDWSSDVCSSDLYLLTACFASGRRAGEGAVAWLRVRACS